MQRGRKEKEKPILLLTREFKTVKNKARKSVAFFFASITSVFTHRHSSEPLIQGFFLGCGNFPRIFLTMLSMLLICSRYYMISILQFEDFFLKKSMDIL